MIELRKKCKLNNRKCSYKQSKTLQGMSGACIGKYSGLQGMVGAYMRLHGLTVARRGCVQLLKGDYINIIF